MSQPASRSSHLNGHHLTRFQNLKNPSTTPAAYCRDLTRLCLRSCLYWSQIEKLSWSRNCLSSKLGRPRRVRGVASFTPRSVDGRATARHLHGKIVRARCALSYREGPSRIGRCRMQSRDNCSFNSDDTRLVPDPHNRAGADANKPSGRGCHLQSRSAPSSWTIL